MEKTEKFLLFEAGKIQFGIPLLDVIEIVNVDNLPIVVHTADIKIARLNKRFVAIVNIYTKFSINKIGDGEKRAQAIIMPIDSALIGVMVYSGIIVDEFSNTQLVPIPKIILNMLSRKYISSFAVKRGKPILILDKENLFSQDELLKIKDLIDKAKSQIATVAQKQNGKNEMIKSERI